MLCARQIRTSRTCQGVQRILSKHICPCIIRRNIPVHEKSVSAPITSLIHLVNSPVCHTEGPQARVFCSDASQGLSASEYEQLADETLDSLTEVFEDLPERLTCDPEYDVTFGSGVLTVKISQSWGTYVINKQNPNKQIWLSSPKSGPKRYDYSDGVWVYKHDGQTMHELLTKEISEAIGKHIDFTDCVYGKR